MNQNYKPKTGLSLLKDQNFIKHMNDINELIDKKIVENRNNTDVKEEKDYIHKSNEYS